MQLEEVLENQKEQYNQFVATNPSGSFLQSFEWGQWQAELGRKVFRYKFSDENGNWLAAVQLIKTPILGKWFYLYAPYGPVTVNGLRVESGEFLRLLKGKFNNAVFIRLEPKDKTFAVQKLVKSANIQPSKTLLIDLSKSEDQLLSEMHHKTRYNIKLAQKHGCEIKDEFDLTVGHGLFFDEALKLILQTANRQKFGTFPASYYKKLVDFFTLHHKGSEVKLHIYKVVWQNKLLSAAIIMDFGNTRSYLFGGSAEENKNIMAPYLLHFQAMLDAKLSGMLWYDFWGIETSSGETPGFVRFKLGFGGEYGEYLGAYDYILKSSAYKLYKFSRSFNKFVRKLK